MNPTAPRRILAVDFGDRRTGLAGTDWTGSIVVPLEKLEGLDDEACCQAIAALAKERDSEVIVFGLPFGAQGQATKRTERTREVAIRLAKMADCPVDTVDEALSTDEAHDRLKSMGVKAAQRKKIADSVSAMVILERYQAMGGARIEVTGP